MKKTILKGLLVIIAVSGLNAADTTALTRTTDKLILSQAKFILKLNELNGRLDNQLVENQKVTDKFKSDDFKLSKIESKIEELKSSIDFNVDKVKQINLSLKDIRSASAKNLVQSETNKGDISKLSLSVLNIAGEVKFAKSKTLLNSKNVTDLKSQIKDLQSQIETNKQIESVHYRELLKKISLMKNGYESKISILKAETPIKIVNDCKLGKCKSSKEAEAIIDNFLR